ncbi:histidine--tRNA ligase, partial [Patescibacteria group bacterium]|nr:histidine--tRNA ligase [Patescibacteria group bacterium]
TVGSVGGGGRYDNLINDLAGYQMPAVGFGIGFDRTVEAADQLGLIPLEGQGTRILVAVMSETDVAGSLEVAQQLRAAGISVEVYPAIDKLAKQFKLADQKQIPYVVVVGEQERAAQKVTLKTLASGAQTLLSLEECVEVIRKN